MGADTFWSTVNTNGDCWLWTGRLDKDGYGMTYTNRHVRAHRLAYEWARGAISNDLEIDHLCKTRTCVRPEHMELVTHRENVLRGDSPSAINARKTHCPRGHELTRENTYVYPSGGRQCRICRASYAASYGPSWRAKRKARSTHTETNEVRRRNK